MKHILILLLLFWDNVEFTLTQEAECSQLPSAEHAFVPDEYKKVGYFKGDVIYFSCNPGYTTGFNTSYICTEQGWRATTYGQCFVKGSVPLRVGCARPPALRHGYALKNSSYFYPDGQKISYKCDHFYKLKGRPYKTCTNGQWIGDLQCVASFCERPQIDNGTLEEEKEKYAENEILRYSCDRGYRKVAGRPSFCLMVDWAAPQWSPSPQCETSTCILSPNPPVGTLHNPVYQLIFRPGQSVTVSCGEKHWVKSRELQSAELTCQDTGLWDFETECQRVTCTKSAENVYHWQNRIFATEMGESVWYRCHGGYVETASAATCTRQGWEPNPLCKDRRCNKPTYRNAEITDIYMKDKYDHHEKVRFRCIYDPTVTFYVDCFYGEWRGSVPTCRDASPPQ